MKQLTSQAPFTGLVLPQKDLHHYLLIDGVKMEPVLTWVYQSIDNPEWFPLYKNTRYHDVIDLSPCLVKIPPDSDVADQFENELGPKGKAICISSFLGVEALGLHLSRLLWIMASDGRYLHYRFYDPVSLSRLMPELTANDCARLYKGVESIVWFNAKQGEWQKLTISHSDGNATEHAVCVFKREWINAIATAD